jgi:preprotein translocase subunit Sec63
LKAILFLLLIVIAVAWLSRTVSGLLAPTVLRDPWQVLGVSRGASAADIHSAYRRRMAEYHPDKVQSMAPEIRELAERRAREINLAYEKLRIRS